MKSRHVASATFAAAAAFASAPAVHAATASITVTANIVAACSFSTPSGTIWNMGDLASDKQSQAKKPFTLTFRCANGAPYTVKIAGSSTGTASAKMTLVGGTSKLPYTLKWAQAVGTTAGATDILLNVDATIDPADINVAALGNYTDSIQVEVNAD